MNDAVRALHPSMAAEHRGAEDCAPVLFENIRPDDQVRIRAFIFKRNEHDAFGGARHLLNENEPRNREQTTIRRLL